MSRKRVPLNQNECTDDFRIGVPFEQNLQIVQMLSDGEKCGCKILDKFNITQPTLSHHMKILVDCELVNDRKEGKWHHYSLNKKVIREASSFIEALGR